MADYEIIDSEELRMVKVTLNGETVRAEGWCPTLHDRKYRNENQKHLALEDF